MTKAKKMPKKQATRKTATKKTPAAPAEDRPQIEAVEDGAPPVREFKLPKKHKVAIVGCADTCKLAPFDRAEEFEFWGVNNLFLTLPGPWTRWFDIHSFSYSETFRRWQRRGSSDFRGQSVDDYLATLQGMDIPIYMQAPVKPVPNAVLFPLDDMVKMFGDYFTNSISYMLALAIAEGFSEIWVLGVDMAVDTEYHWQRPSCEYFIGLARGRGIRVMLPDECDLLKTRFLYGFHEIQELAFSKKLKSMRVSMIRRQQKAIGQLEMAKKQVEQYQGAISAEGEINKIWGNTVDMWPKKKKSGGIHEI